MQEMRLLMKQEMSPLTARIYAVLLLALMLAAGGLVLFVQAKTGSSFGDTVSSLNPFSSAATTDAGQTPVNPAESWQSRKEKALKAVSIGPTMTPEQLLQFKNNWEKREYARTAEQSWHQYLGALERYGQMKQKEIDEVAKTDPAKAEKMTADWQRTREKSLEYHKQARAKGFTPSEELPNTAAPPQ